MINSLYVYYGIKNKELDNDDSISIREKRIATYLQWVNGIITAVGSIIVLAYISTYTIPFGWIAAPLLIGGSFPFAILYIFQQITQSRHQRVLQKYPDIPPGQKALISIEEYRAYVRQVETEDMYLLIFHLHSAQEKEMLIQTIGLDQYLQGLRRGAIGLERTIAYLPWTEGFDALKAHITPQFLTQLKADAPALSLFCFCANYLKTSDRIRLAKMLLSDGMELFPYKRTEYLLESENFTPSKDPVFVNLKDIRRYSHLFSMDSLPMEASAIGKDESSFQRCRLVFSEFIDDLDRENLNALSFLLFTEGDYEKIETLSLFRFINKYFAPLFNTLMHFMTEEERTSCGAPKKLKIHAQL